MAGQGPDPRSLNSWEDAFQHPLPVVRKLEQQLRKNINENRQKLRSLVGASYRDLLGTAERIIEMDDQMQTVETYLGEIGKKCNANTVEKIAENHARMQKAQDARDGDRYGAMAQTKILQNCLTAVSRTIKAGGDALQASKLFVLARLLHKSVSECSHPPTVLEDLRRKLVALRSRLLSYIERKMVRPSTDKSALANTLCAYALVTSSTPKDVLRHFLQTRYDQLDARLDSPSEVDVLQMLDFYSQTLLDTHDLFPRRVADALSQLSRVPLLQDEQVRSAFELNIDMYGTWITEDVRGFTPWVRHDQLAVAEVSEALTSWTKQARTSLLTSLQDYLSGQDDARVIATSRYKFISKFMRLNVKLRTEISAANAIAELRAVFLKRLQGLAVQSSNLTNLTLDDPDISKSFEHASDDSSMWDLAAEDFDLSRGAFKLRQSILRIHRGGKFCNQAETEKLDEWLKQVNGLLDVADELSATKWDEELDSDIEELDDGDMLQRMLSKEDPEQLRHTLREAVLASLNDFISTITATAATTKHASYYLRMWREIDLRRRMLEHRLGALDIIISLQELHRNIAVSVSGDAIEHYTRPEQTTTLAGVALWVGAPPLPVQPSPSTFKFLSDLHRSMSNVGTDLWSPKCVTETKVVVLDSLSTGLDTETFTTPSKISSLTNGHVEVGYEDGEDAKAANVEVNGTKTSGNEQLVQNLFDIYYLHRVLNPSGNEIRHVDKFSRLIRTIELNSRLDDASQERLKKSAVEYWRRTYLLFGLLAPGIGEETE